MRRSIAAVLVLLGLGSGDALANGKTALVVVSETSGALAAGVAERLGDEAKAGLEARGWSATVELSPKKALRQCLSDDDKSCLAKVASGSDAVLHLRLRQSTAAEETGTFVLGSLERAKGEGALLQRFCKCESDDSSSLAPIINELVLRLADEELATSSPSALAISCDPPQAQIELNGSPVVVGEHRIAAGKQTVTAKMAGFVPQTFSIYVDAGEQKTLEIRLTEVEGPGRPWGPIGLGAAGVLTTAIGITLIVLHQDPVSGGEQQPTTRDSKSIGIITTTVGVGLIAGAGVIYLLRGGDSAESVAPSAAISPAGDGFAVGLSGRF